MADLRQSSVTGFGAAPEHTVPRTTAAGSVIPATVERMTRTPDSPLLASLAAGRRGVLTYGITPPKRTWDQDRIREVAARQVERIANLPIDGLVVYDLQDESSRTDAERPFPFQEPLDPVDYAQRMLAGVDVPKIVYRCVSRLDPERLRDGLDRLRQRGDATVLVGAASRDQQVTMRLSEAYEARKSEHGDVLTGGVLIGERHRENHAEHDRVLAKVDAGCSFFVTQAVWSARDTKDVLSDLAIRCEDEGRPIPPVLVTLTPCGSEQTLTFLRWLGIDVPRWLANDILRAADTLAASVVACERTFEDLWEFALLRGIPLGCNVESVSLARREIEASVDLVARIRTVVG